jgi:SAM-dependent methyltransferase
VIASRPGPAVWHDVECASYAADLPLWRELADRAGGEVLDIGCGTGRVALDLATHGHRVMGVDPDPDLIRALATRSRSLLDLGAYSTHNPAGVQAVVGDARSFDLGRRFALAIAPMQVVQLLGGPEGRARMLARVKDHLHPGALLAAAVADPFEGFDAETALPPLPDVREEDGWVLSSTPIAVRTRDDAVEIDRHRQAVSPSGELSEEIITISLDVVDADTLAAEGEAVGFNAREPRRIPETRDHVGSTVVLLQC